MLKLWKSNPLIMRELLRWNSPSSPKTAMTSKEKTESANLALYEKLVATMRGVERKGDTRPYTSLNGHMFSCLHPSGLALRLPAEEREEFLKKYKTTLFESYGAVQKEYVAVPETLLRNTKKLQKYFSISYRYVQTLKPKPSKKKT